MTNILKSANIVKKAEPEVFKILNVGKRGVGKTVFIAGAYVELSSKAQTENPQKLWLEVQESENIKIILDYVDKNSQYPPPTVKINRSSFSLKQRSWLSLTTLSNFIWTDIPGEICNIDNSDFREMVFNSHGCSVFIDAVALMFRPDYQQELQEIIELITPLINLSILNRLRFPFVFILTKCDLLEDEPVAQQRINEKLKPLIEYLNLTNIKYQIFYSSIPLVTENEVSSLKPKGAAEPLAWLVRQVCRSQSTNSLIKVYDDLRPKQNQSPEGITAKTKISFLVRKLSKHKYILIFYIIMIAITGSLIGLFGREIIDDIKHNVEIKKNQ